MVKDKPEVKVAVVAPTPGGVERRTPALAPAMVAGGVFAALYLLASSRGTSEATAAPSGAPAGHTLEDLVAAVGCHGTEYFTITDETGPHVYYLVSLPTTEHEQQVRMHGRYVIRHVYNWAGAITDEVVGEFLAGWGTQGSFCLKPCSGQFADSPVLQFMDVHEWEVPSVIRHNVLQDRKQGLMDLRWRAHRLKVACLLWNRLRSRNIWTPQVAGRVRKTPVGCIIEHPSGVGMMLPPTYPTTLASAAVSRAIGLDQSSRDHTLLVAEAISYLSLTTPKDERLVQCTEDHSYSYLTDSGFIRGVRLIYVRNGAVGSFSFALKLVRDKEDLFSLWSGDRLLSTAPWGDGAETIAAEFTRRLRNVWPEADQPFTSEYIDAWSKQCFTDLVENHDFQAAWQDCQAEMPEVQVIGRNEP